VTDHVCPSCFGTGAFNKPGSCTPCRGSGFLSDECWEEYWHLFGQIPPSDSSHSPIGGNPQRVQPPLVLECTTVSEDSRATHGRLTDDEHLPEEVTPHA
jgi:hypothetical protein